MFHGKQSKTRQNKTKPSFTFLHQTFPPVPCFCWKFRLLPLIPAFCNEDSEVTGTENSCIREGASILLLPSSTPSLEGALKNSHSSTPTDMTCLAHNMPFTSTIQSHEWASQSFLHVYPAPCCGLSVLLNSCQYSELVLCQCRRPVQLLVSQFCFLGVFSFVLFCLFSFSTLLTFVSTLP